MAEESVTVFLRAQIGEFTGKMREAGMEAESMGRKGQSSFQRFQAIGSAALLAVGTVALAVGAYGLKMADEYEAAHARLETAVKNSGGNFDEYKGKIAAVSKTMEGLGFSNTETESSLATLTGVTHSTSKAIELQGLAADIARGRHIDLATATNILVKVESGHVGALGRLGINTKDVTGKTIDQETAIKRLTQLYGGQAGAYTDTFAGKIAVLKTKGEDLAKNIGLMLIPVIERLVSIGLGVVQFFQRANDATGGWLGKLALLAIAAPLAVVAVTKIVSGIGAVVQAVGAGASALASFGETIALFAMLNPEITALIAVAAGIGAVVAALHIWGGAHDQAKKEAKSFTTALDEDTSALGRNTDAVGVNTAALIRKELTDRNQIDDLGRLADELHNGKSAWETWEAAINGGTNAQRQLRQAMVDAGEIQITQIGTATESAATMAKLRAEWVRSGGDINELAKRVGGLNDVTNVGITGNTGLVASLDSQTAARKASKSALDDEHAAGVRNKDGKIADTKATGDNTEAQKKNLDAMKARTDALNAQRDAALGLIGADLSMDESLNTLSRDVADYNDKTKVWVASHGKSKEATDALTDSTFQLKRGILDTVNAAVSDVAAQDAQRRARGRNISTEQEAIDKNKAAIGTLLLLKAQYPELAAIIQGYIDKLNAIPPTKATNVVATINGQQITAQQFSAGFSKGGFGLGGFAGGGTIGAGELATVGERGTEIVEALPGGGVRVLTNAQSRRFLAQPSASATAGTGQIVIDVGGVNVRVEGTNATTDDIQAAVRRGVREGGADIVDGLLKHQRLGNMSILETLARG